MNSLRFAATLLISSLLLLPGASIAMADQFSTVVTEILQAQTDGPLSRMSPQKKAAMISCVNKTLVDMPNGKKRYVLEGTNFDDRESRFGKVVMENRAEWKQKMARACSSIAVSGGV